MTDSRYQEAKKITIIGAVVNAFLGIIKIIGGFFFHSHALFADGVHSFSDLLVDCMVLFASRFGSLDADDTHPYGHQRIETAATLLLSFFLILAGILIAWDGLSELLSHGFTKPQAFAFPIAFLSIMLNEVLFYFTHRVGVKVRSSLIIANAWHHRSDSLASLVVLLGLMGSFLGFTYFDVIAAIVVAFMIIKMGVNYSWQSILELVDTAAAEDIRHHIEKTLMTLDGVQKIHQLRTRLMGGDIVVDLHILVLPKLSVSEGHYIAQHVHHSLMSRFERIKDVTVHVDPEDDELSCPSMYLPSRNTLQPLLFEPLKAQFPMISKINLHYLDGFLHIDLITQKINASSLKDLKTEATIYFEKFPFIKAIEVFEIKEEFINSSAAREKSSL